RAVFVPRRSAAAGGFRGGDWLLRRRVYPAGGPGERQGRGLISRLQQPGPLVHLPHARSQLVPLQLRAGAAARRNIDSVVAVRTRTDSAGNRQERKNVAVSGAGPV